MLLIFASVAIFTARLSTLPTVRNASSKRPLNAHAALDSSGFVDGYSRSIHRVFYFFICYYYNISTLSSHCRSLYFKLHTLNFATYCYHSLLFTPDNEIAHERFVHPIKRGQVHPIFARILASPIPAMKRWELLLSYIYGVFLFIYYYLRTCQIHWLCNCTIKSSAFAAVYIHCFSSAFSISRKYNSHIVNTRCNG